MTREDIEKFSVVEPSYFKTEKEERWYKFGCIDGLIAADEKPNLESLWHDVEEEPKYGEWFLVQIGDSAFDSFIMTMDKNQDWRNWSNGNNIKRWAYINDLLPKGCKNEND